LPFFTKIFQITKTYAILVKINELHMTTSIPTSTLEKFTTFGDLLRYLRRAAGLTQLELSVQVGYSHAQISRLEQNLRLPDLPSIEARFVPALGLESEPKAVARLMELAANVRREDAPGPGLCPYKGLDYFDETDADLFVGRETLTAKLTERVLSLTSSGLPHQTRFLAVVGATGSGKSSLVRAGVVPALRWNRKSADWYIQILTPTAHPLESLAASLTAESESVSATATLMDDLLRDPRSLQIFGKRKLQSENNSHLLLVIDQFEELFTLCRSEEEKALFIGNLLAASSEARGPTSVVITLRGHSGAVTSIAYSPDSSRIGTTSQDGTAKLWNATTGEELLTFSGDGSELNDIAFSPNGARLATGGSNGVHIYLLHIKDLIALAQTRVTRSLTSEECQRYCTQALQTVSQEHQFQQRLHCLPPRIIGYAR
jgi:transcriptional regulator with XRE-family HTH domain/energy-coupling factor transporter ATP-binding protein EcfA2